MKAFPCFALVLGFASSGVSAQPVGYFSQYVADAELCKSRELSMTPDRRHVYSYSQYKGMLFSNVDCLEAGAANCTVRITSLNFPSDAFFSGDRLYHHDIFGLVERLPLDKMLAQPGRYEGKPVADLKTTGEETTPIHIYPSDAENDPSFYRDLKAFSQKADQVRDKNIGFHSHNMFGMFTTNLRFYMHVNNDFDVFTSFSGKPPVHADVHGNAYEAENFIPLKVKNRAVVANVSGSVLMFSDSTKAINQTSAQPRSHFINGENPVKYSGYFNSWGLHEAPAGHRSASDVTGYVSGVYLTDGASAVTTVSSLDADAQPVYSHTVRIDSRKVNYTCPSAIRFDYQVRPVNAKASLWAEDYTVNTSKQRVFYLYGGPSDYVGVENGASVVNYLLRHGINVTVLNYGGTRYTYSTSTRLFDDGYKALDSDARDMEAFVKARYPERTTSFLMMSSFGANYHKRFTPELLSGFASVVMMYPAGTKSPDFNAEPGKVAGIYRKIVGPELLAGLVDTAYFKTLDRCPLLQKTLIVYGAKDTTTVPRTDYATCANDPQVTWAEFPGGHGENPDDVYPYILNYIRTQP